MDPDDSEILDAYIQPAIELFKEAVREQEDFMAKWDAGKVCTTGDFMTIKDINDRAEYIAHQELHRRLEQAAAEVKSPVRPVGLAPLWRFFKALWS